MPFSPWLSRPKKSGRHNTISVALPASIVENAQGGELKALLVGQMARALTIYGVDEAWKSQKDSCKGVLFLNGGGWWILIFRRTGELCCFVFGGSLGLRLWSGVFGCFLLGCHEFTNATGPCLTSSKKRFGPGPGFWPFRTQKKQKKRKGRPWTGVSEKVTPGTDFEVSKSPGVLFEVIVFEDRSDAPRSDEETREKMCVHGFNGKRLGLGWKNKLLQLGLNLVQLLLGKSDYLRVLSVQMESQPLYPHELKQVCDNEMWWHFFSFHALNFSVVPEPLVLSSKSDWLFKDHLVVPVYIRVRWPKDSAKPAEDGISNGMAFFARNLQYLETPQYLRKQLVPVHKAGLGSLWICGWEIWEIGLADWNEGKQIQSWGVDIWQRRAMNTSLKWLYHVLHLKIFESKTTNPNLLTFFQAMPLLMPWGFEMGGSIGSLGCTTSPAQERAFAIPGRCCMGTFLSRDSCLWVSGFSSCLLT